MLEYTSCFFAAVAIHAYASCVPSYQYVFQLVTVLSVWHHTSSSAFVAIIDAAMAHAAFLFVLLDSPTIVAKHMEWLFLFPATVLCLWLAEHVYPRWNVLLHAALHVVAATGANAFIYFLYDKCAL